MITKDNTTKEMTIKVPTLNINNISDIYYEEPQNFENSIHSEAYENALHITKGIINSTRDKVLDDEKDSKRGIGTRVRNKEQVCNIIFFTGDKGTGKTSTMLSYMEFLKDYHRNKENNRLGKFEIGTRDFMFTGIEHIDASSLDSKEDILGSVLSKMLNKWKIEEERSNAYSGIVRGLDYDYNRRQLRVLFAEVYECLKDLRSTKDLLERDTDMFLETIEKLSLSWNVKQAFQRLVERYLDIMVYPGSEKSINKDNHFLVISIDDLDMNVNYSFMLLEQIRKYLMVPNVIVLMSANYEQLEKNCHNHYLKEFKYMEKVPGNLEYTYTLSREYLEKMIPIQRQVKLKSGKRWEFFTNEELRIQCENGNGMLKKIIEKPGTICTIASRYMHNCLGVNFNPKGESICYLAPKTIRETCGWINQINDLESIYEKDGCINKQKYEENLRVYWFDEFQKICRRNLSEDESKIFKELDILEPAEQIRIIMEFLNKKAGLIEKSFLGLLLEIKRKQINMQDLIPLCIIYFNMKMSYSMFQMRWKTEEDIKQEEKNKKDMNLLLKYYSVGEWGIWGVKEREMLPPMRKTIANTYKHVRIARTVFDSNNACLSMELDVQGELKQKKEVKNFIAINKENLVNYQYLLLFYKLNINNVENSIWERFGGNRIKLLSGYKGIFSLSGFVLNLLEGAPLNKRFEEMFKGSALLNSVRFSEKEKQDIWNDISIFRWGEQDTYEIPLIPIYDVEFMLYMGQRLQRDLGQKVKSDLSNPVIIKQIKNYFTVIIECLREYDTKYSEYFTERFEKFGLVQRIMCENKAFLNLLAENIDKHKELYTPIENEIENEWSI